jgi:hypothetical protein
MAIGTSPGDTGGDLNAPTPARALTASEGVCSPDWLSGSLFWMLQPSDDEDDGEEDREEDSSISVRCFCRSPSPVTDADLLEESAELTRRHLKRIKRRNDQRMATRAAMMFSTTEGMNSSLSLPLGKNHGLTSFKVMLVLEPIVFFGDNDEGWTVVRQRHWSPAFGAKTRDPRKKENSKKPVVGLVSLRAGANSSTKCSSPNLARQRGSCFSRSNGDQGPRLVKIGNAVA